MKSTTKRPSFTALVRQNLAGALERVRTSPYMALLLGPDEGAALAYACNKVIFKLSVLRQRLVDAVRRPVVITHGFAQDTVFYKGPWPSPAAKQADEDCQWANYRAGLATIKEIAANPELLKEDQVMTELRSRITFLEGVAPTQGRRLRKALAILPLVQEASA